MDEQERISEAVYAVRDSVEAVPDALKKDAAIVAVEAVPDEAKREIVADLLADASSSVKREMAAAAVRTLSREEQEQVVETLAEGLGCDRGWKPDKESWLVRFLDENAPRVRYEGGIEGERVVVGADSGLGGHDDVSSAKSSEGNGVFVVDEETAALRSQTKKALEGVDESIERLRAWKF